MATENEIHRYIEYLQGKLFTPDTEAVVDQSSFLAWLKSNVNFDKRMMSSYPGTYSSGLIAEFESKAQDFKPSTNYETYFASAIFDPILNEVVNICSGMGLKLKGNLSIANSTSSYPSPVSRPADGSHVLFIGAGTSTFCNYWAKALSALIYELSLCASDRFTDVEVVSKHLKANLPLLKLPVSLALYQALAGTVFGFGEVSEQKQYTSYRIQLLDAMEVFSVAHEYCHFLAEERFEKYRGILTPEMTQELERFCDTLGMAICQKYGEKNDNFLAFSGAGPMLLFRCMRLVDVVADKFSIDRPQIEDTHPDHLHRIVDIEKQSLRGVHEDQKELVRNYCSEIRVICDSIEKVIQDTF